MDIPGLEFGWTPERDVAIVRVVGRVAVEDLPAAEESGARLVTSQTSRVVVDLSRAERVSSMALGLILYYQNVLSGKGGGLVLAAPSAPVLRALTDANLDRVMTTYETVEAAVEAIRK